MSDSLNLLAYQAGLVSTPETEQEAGGYSELCVDQKMMRIGDPLPIIFARREGTVGGVLVSPGATEVRFENNETNVLTTSWHLCLGEGPITPIMVKDVFQCACRVGTATQAFGQRAGSWASGNFTTELEEPYTPWELPRFCGSPGTFDGLHTLSFVNSFEDSENWNQQIHAFVRGGLKVTRLVDNVYDSSSNVVDLYLHLLRVVARIPDSLIDFDALTLAAKFQDSLGLRFDGILGKEQTNNLDNWAESVLKPFFLLQQTRIAGKEALIPLLPVNSDGTLNLAVITPVVTLTEQELDLDTWDLEFLSLADRRPICAQMQWRQQNDGILSVVRTTEVRFEAPYNAPDGPFEQHDISEFGTSETHSVKVGAYIIAYRALSTHTLEVSARPGSYNTSISDGSIIRVTVPIEVDGQFSTIHSYCYRVVTVGYDLRGQTKLSLMHLPLDSQGRSAISQVVASAQPTGTVIPITFEGPICDVNSELDDSYLLEDLIDWGLPEDNPYEVPLDPPGPLDPPPPPPEDPELPPPPPEEDIQGQPTGQGILLQPHTKGVGEFILLKYSEDLAMSKYGNLGDKYAEDNFSGFDYPGFVAVGKQVKVTSLQRVSISNVISCNLSGDHGFENGDMTTISGADQGIYNGNHQVTVTGSSSFTYMVSAPPDIAVATGEISATIVAETLMLAKGVMTAKMSDYPYFHMMRMYGGDWGIWEPEANEVMDITSNGYPDTVPASLNYGFFYHLTDYDGPAQKAGLYAERLPAGSSQINEAYYKTSTFEIILNLPETPPNNLTTKTYYGCFLKMLLGGFQFYVAKSITYENEQGAAEYEVILHKEWDFSMTGPSAPPYGGNIIIPPPSGRSDGSGIVPLQPGEHHFAVVRSIWQSTVSVQVFISSKRVFAEDLEESNLNIQELLPFGVIAQSHEAVNPPGSGNTKVSAIKNNQFLNNSQGLGFHSFRFTPLQALYDGATIQAPTRISSLSGNMTITSDS